MFLESASEAEASSAWRFAALPSTEGTARLVGGVECRGLASTDMPTDRWNLPAWGSLPSHSRQGQG